MREVRFPQWLISLAGRFGRLVGAHIALSIALALGVVVSILLTKLFGELYEAVLEQTGVAALDRPVLDFAIAHRSPVLDDVVTGYTDIGGVIGMPILALVIMVILAVRRKSWTPVILIVAAAAGSLGMTVLGKELVGRARPPLMDAVPPYEYSPSFPSGHSLNAFVIAGIVAYLLVLYRKTLHAKVITIGVAALFAFTIGLSRVFLGHHWLTDVLAAWVLGAVWLTVVILAHRLFVTVTGRDAATLKDGERIQATAQGDPRG